MVQSNFICSPIQRKIRISLCTDHVDLSTSQHKVTRVRVCVSARIVYHCLVSARRTLRRPIDDNTSQSINDYRRTICRKAQNCNINSFSRRYTGQNVVLKAIMGAIGGFGERVYFYSAHPSHRGWLPKTTVQWQHFWQKIRKHHWLVGTRTADGIRA